MDKCKHEPAFERATIHENEDRRLIVDVPCSKCGCSGSFDATPNPTDINW